MSVKAFMVGLGCINLKLIILKFKFAFIKNCINSINHVTKTFVTDIFRSKFKLIMVRLLN